MKVYTINEIFHSIQGEGHNTGMSAVFVRFAGCNLNCWFCDTDFTIKHRYTEDELVDKIKKYNCRNIVFTGGEPTLQLDSELLSRLKDYYTCLESNGLNKINILLNLDFVTISPKMLFNQFYGDELKVVYTDQITEKMLDDYEKLDFKYFYLQPCYEKDGSSNYLKVIEKIKERTPWRLSLQTQKMLKIR